MSTTKYLLALDQGTTSSRAIIFDADGRKIALAQRELAQHYPAPAWVEHDPEEIWSDCIAVMTEAIRKAGVDARQIQAIGITNQRETVVVWERSTGKPIYPAIVWQDKRTAELCHRLVAQGIEGTVQKRTGLLVDAYFSATKIKWILDNVAGARAAAERGDLACGTVDCFLLWRLTGGRVHATDASNASRTMLYDIQRQCWDPELTKALEVPAAMLPEVRDSSGLFGEVDGSLLGAAIPICGMAGDQQAALIGQSCLSPGMAKATYGTGGFLLLNIGKHAPVRHSRLISTIAYRLETEATYALEGSIFVAGAAIKWLRDRMRFVEHADETAKLAASLPNSHGVYLVPAFVGMGAPHWKSDARAVLSGLTLDSGPEHVVRAALEAVAYQTLDLVRAMKTEGSGGLEKLRIDGGMAANDWFAQFLADILQVTIERPEQLETTALGAAYLAGLSAGIWANEHTLAQRWTASSQFEPSMDPIERDQLVSGWDEAIKRAIT